jgi:CubicO group peptidase (beta-lactamase class C family)
MRQDAIIPLASVGKMYTAVAAMILVERGAIALDDPVSRYIPEFANVRVEVADAAGATRLAAPETAVTIRHLMTHTGGLRMSGDGFWAAWNANVARTTTLEMARALAALPLESQPGARFNYGVTGASYEALAAIIEIASGQTLEEFMSENIFAPLELNDTHFYLPADKSERMPAFHRRVDGALRLDRAHGEDFPRSTYFNGGGGVESSPQDILRFAQLFLNDGAVDGVRVLRPETVRLMMSDQLGARATLPGGLSWGLGAAVQRGASPDAPGQYGWIGGNYAVLWVDRRERLVAYFAFPIMPPGDSALINDYRRLVYAAMAPGDAAP